MEDAHIANLDIGDGISIFGVFDGHGGELFIIKFNHHLAQINKNLFNHLSLTIIL